MQVYAVPVRGVFTTNCYFMIDKETGHGFLVDPGAQGKELLGVIRKNGWTIEKILLTHGHFDHTGGIQTIRRELDIPVYCYENGSDYLLDPVLNLSREYGPDVIVRDFHTFADGDIIRLQAAPACGVKVIHTPGHTRDSVCFYDEADGIMLVGDTIFKGQPGNDGYPSGNGPDLINSIIHKILPMPDNTLLLSGHSEPTTVGDERSLYSTPYFRKLFGSYQ